MPECDECGLLFSKQNLNVSQIDRALLCGECISREACIICHEEGQIRINDVCYCKEHFVPKPASVDAENGMWICECGKEANEVTGYCENGIVDCFHEAKSKRKCIHCNALQIPYNYHVCSVCNSHQHIIQEGGKGVRRYVKRGGFSFDKHF